MARISLPCTYYPRGCAIARRIRRREHKVSAMIERMFAQNASRDKAPAQVTEIALRNNKSTDLSLIYNHGLASHHNHVKYTGEVVHNRPSNALLDNYNINAPAIALIVTICCMVFLIGFWIGDWLCHREMLRASKRRGRGHKRLFAPTSFDKPKWSEKDQIRYHLIANDYNSVECTWSVDDEENAPLVICEPCVAKTKWTKH